MRSLICNFWNCVYFSSIQIAIIVELLQFVFATKIDVYRFVLV